MPKKKNAVRCAPAAFEGLLHPVEYSESDALSSLALAFGHLVKTDDTGTATIFPEYGGPHVFAPPGSWRSILQDFLSVPVGATPFTAAPVEGFPDVDFYVFSSETPVLFVRKPHAVSKVCSVTFDAVWTQGTLGDIDALLSDGEIESPWADFFVGVSDADSAVTPVWRVDLSCKEVLPGAAAHLVRAGYIVACCGPAAPTFVKVKSTCLKPTNDSACATTMSTINDAMPGLTAGTDLYTADLQVHRCMLHWSMLAGCRAAQAQTRASEPLASYLATLDAVKVYRRETGRVDSFSGTEATLKYNTAEAISGTQRQQAVSFFYWATLQEHVSGNTRELLRRALSMYLHFGVVVLRKRAYEFRGKGKKQREAGAGNAILK